MKQKRKPTSRLKKVCLHWRPIRVEYHTCLPYLNISIFGEGNNYPQRREPCNWCDWLRTHLNTALPFWDSNIIIKQNNLGKEENRKNINSSRNSKQKDGIHLSFKIKQKRISQTSWKFLILARIWCNNPS